jgi:hypothetical protein
MNFDNADERRRWLDRLVSKAERRARIAELTFDLPQGYASTLFDQQGGQCAVTGIEFNFQGFPDAFVQFPFSPSIDRRLSTGGYTTDNVRLVCAAVNFGMGQWGEEVFLTLARAAVDSVDRRTLDTSSVWRANLLDRLRAAEEMLRVVPESERAKQRHRIAGMRSALAKGFSGVKDAAQKAKGDTQG